MNIGELSRLTGLPVKTIRYYSDVGLVPESSRTASGYRRYDHGALVRLEFVRTLRELGLDLATIRQVLDRGASLREVAAAHAAALGTQIRVLKLRRAALRAAAGRDTSPGDLERLARIAQASTDERQRIVDEFFESIFLGIADSPDARKFTAGMRSVSADLPDEPTDEQVDAWIELAEMLRAEDFRARLREMGRRSFAPDAERIIPTDMSDIKWFVDIIAEAQDGGRRAPGEVVDEVMARWAEGAGRPDGQQLRREVVDALELANEPRAERYWQLMAIINGWPPIPSTMHRWSWFLSALKATLDR
ncbi:MerR family transcriptional regulator [Dactylosporangium matsuzakiense]|uniref:MerR family transcriptional regulator n=1 Tax=Dactylosporangium matsuzakiense TaxID=53360 RepID=A0A9W6KML9_9ACTN|nr:MerR family transcriptional regulator [Dactylosporangium matsuzakiense]UWZ45731.1 MerR family transcriptional regulator [Dactylosporangium matsuzakiense]GLL04008.1 MerR family transcriptional regulator [Dactylosporangium matsuzakiense]